MHDLERQIAALESQVRELRERLEKLEAEALRRSEVPSLLKKQEAQQARRLLAEARGRGLA